MKIKKEYNLKHLQECLLTYYDDATTKGSFHIKMPFYILSNLIDVMEEVVNREEQEKNEKKKQIKQECEQNNIIEELLTTRMIGTFCHFGIKVKDNMRLSYYLRVIKYIFTVLPISDKKDEINKAVELIDMKPCFGDYDCLCNDCASCEFVDVCRIYRDGKRKANGNE